MSRGRRSPHERHKFKIAEMVKSGQEFSAIKSAYPDIPPATLKRWIDEFTKRFEKPLPESPKVALRVIESDSNDSSDLEWAKTRCKEIFKEEYDNQIKLRAIDVFLKAVAMDKGKEGVEEESEDLTEQYRSMTAEELARVYKDALG